MTDPQVFYNREDLWAAPKEKYAGEVQAMEPYYILAKLPGSDQLEYMHDFPDPGRSHRNPCSSPLGHSGLPTELPVSYRQNCIGDWRPWAVMPRRLSRGSA